MKKKGEITVFLALLLSILVGFVYVLIEDIRSDMYKNEASIAADAAIRSCFGEYNKAVYDRFHIYLLDSSYKTNEADIEKMKQHFVQYMQVNLKDLSLDELTVVREQNAGENDCELLYNLALRYMTGRGIYDNYGNIGKDALFREYLFLVCTNCTGEEADGRKMGETEYLISGDETFRPYLEEEYINSGMDYEDFLHDKLYETNIDILRNRFGEVVTEYAQNNGSPGFSLKECYGLLELEAHLMGSNSKEYTLRREYAYEEESSP